MSQSRLTAYARGAVLTLARAPARSGDQNERDHAALAQAVATGAVKPAEAS